jgi:hypothetical protein
MEGDQGIWFATHDGNQWSPQQNIPGVFTSFRPTLGVYTTVSEYLPVYNGLAYMAWKGTEGDTAIYYTTYDGSNWAPQQQVPGVFSNIGPGLVNLC